MKTIVLVLIKHFTTCAYCTNCKGFIISTKKNEIKSLNSNSEKKISLHILFDLDYKNRCVQAQHCHSVIAYSWFAGQAGI
jgi:hypothetical protein